MPNDPTTVQYVIPSSCLTCGSATKSKPSKVRKFCSPHCYHIDMTKRRGANTPRWTGNNVGYISLHQWVSQNRGKPSLCENCGSTDSKRYEWANISKEYKRELSDWMRLCKSCHVKYDRVMEKAWITRKAQI